MNIKRPLAPGLLNKLDNWLLQNHPAVWSARAHLVFYYTLLTAIPIAIISYLEPTDPRDYSIGGYWTGLISIVSIIGLVVWLIYLLRFNVFKRFGILSPRYALVTFLLYFFSVGCFVALPYIPSYIETLKTKQQFSIKEIIQDINTINTLVCQIEYDSMNHKWGTDTVLFHASTHAVPFDYSPNHRIIDSSELMGHQAAGDSISALNDSVYVLYTHPDYKLLSNYDIDVNYPGSLLTDTEIYHKVIKNYNPGNKSEALATVQRIITKYGGLSTVPSDHEIATESDIAPYRQFAPRTNYHIEGKYDIQTAERNISNVSEKLLRWTSNKAPVLARIFYYITLSITLLVFIFRQTERKTFFLSLLAALLLVIFSGLLLSFYRSSDTDVITMLIFYAALFFALSLQIWSNKTRSTVAGIALNLFIFCIPYIPLIVFHWFYIVKKPRVPDQTTINYHENNMYPITHPLEHYHIYAEIGGAILLLVLLTNYVHYVYRRWYALPSI